VLGVIIAFHALGAAGQNTSQMGSVMAGIAEALVATGVGLFVALPAVVAYNVIQKRIGEIESNALSFTKLMTAYVKTQLITQDRAQNENKVIARAFTGKSDAPPAPESAANGTESRSEPAAAHLA
jgi:biopolymer transport protein ExbB/biopolymer transport protein TolQ